MSMQRSLVLSSLGWIAVISLLHAGLNEGLFHRAAGRDGTQAAPFRVGFLPVT
jgi:hypothetical protein